MRFRRGLRPGPYRAELQSSPDQLVSGTAGEGKVGEGREGGKAKGLAFLHFFFYNLTTAEQCIAVFELHASQSMPCPLTSREGPHT